MVESITLTDMSRDKTTVNQPEDPAWMGTLARRLQAVRQDRGLSLAQVAAETGISRSFLALLEKGQTDISLGRLLPLLQFYKLSMADVLDWEDSERDGVVRAGEAPFLFSIAYGMDAYLAAPDRTRPFLPVVVVCQPGATMSQYSAHDGEEFIFVIEGSVRVSYRDAEPVVLHAGDSVFFTSRRAHLIAADGNSTARALVITTDQVAESQHS
jgi:quercetin dioxygenase-like cupin family protein